MNGYFKVIVNPESIDLKVFPATDGGNPIQINELTDYLTRQKIAFDLKDLNNKVTSAINPTQFEISKQVDFLPISESCEVYVSPDRMLVTGRFYPASNNGKEMDHEDVLSRLRADKVKYGFEEETIERFLKERHYCEDYVLAKGKSVVEGTDAVIEYNFPTERKIKPTMNEDGSVDFFSLNVVNHVKVGDVLATLIPEYRGEDGFDVLGNIIKPKTVKHKALQFGLNIEINEERTVLTSQVDGHVTLYNDKVFVSNVYEVENVDNSTGNIEYEGNVQINGNVSSNFIVKAKGDVSVKGVVEGATIISGGNIVITKGMNGGGKGKLLAKGNIIAKFIENTQVFTEGSIITNQALQSTLQAGDEIVVENSKGGIIGGVATARNRIKAKNIGSEMGGDTKIHVGCSPEELAKYRAIMSEMETIKDSLEKTAPTMEAVKKKITSGLKVLPQQMAQFTELLNTVKEQQEQLKAKEDELLILRNKIEAAGNAIVQVQGTVYPGVVINISDLSMLIKQEFKYCRFVRDKGEVCMRPL